MNLIKTEYYEYYKPKKLDINIKREIYQCNLINQLIQNKIITFDELLLSTNTIDFDHNIIPYIEKHKKLLEKYRNQTKKIKDDYEINVINRKDIIILTCKTYDIFKITKKLYNKIKSQMIYKTKYLNEILYILFLRYKTFGLLNGHLGSIPSKIYNKLIDKDLQLEMFGSLFNHTSKYYCGLFVDLEYIFGCVGNFYNVKFKKGLYLANPPFDINVINNLNNYLLNKINKNCDIIVVLPVWTVEFRKELNKICKNKLLTDYETDVNTKKYLNDKYCKYFAMYCKNNFVRGGEM